jgi:sugar lactone lactonase YvrE
MRGSLVRRLLAVCAVTVMVCAAVALAQNGAPGGAIVVTGQNYPSSFRIDSPSGTPLPHGIFLVHNGSQESSVAFGRRVGVLTTAAAPAARVLLVFATQECMGVCVLQFFPDSGLAFAGSGQIGFAGDGGDATKAELSLSQDSLAKRSGIASAADGTLYIADTKNSTIRAVAGPSSSEPKIIRSVAGKWAPAQNVALVEPLGIAVDRAGNLYIADHTAGTVSVLSKTTGELTILAHVASPASIAVTLDDSKLFVASPDTGAVVAIQTATRAIAMVPGFAPALPAADAQAANSGPCAALESGAAATKSPLIPAAVPASAGSRSVCPAGLAVDGRGNLFVADANGGNILRVDATSGKTSDAAVGMIAPGDIAFDPQGDLFVSEQGRNRIIALGALGDPASNITITAPAPPSGPGCAQGATFTYCNEPTSGTSPSFAFTLTNTSATAVSGITITPAFEPAGTKPTPPPTNFTTTSTSCTVSLGPGASCVINVAFTPLNVGPITGTLTVTDSNPSDLATQDLAGTGDDFSMQIVPNGTPLISVAQGGTATFMAQVNAVGVFGASGETVTLQCPINIPIFTTCAFTPCPVTPTVNGATTFNIVIVTSTNTSPAPPVLNPCDSTKAAVRARRGAAPIVRAIRERLDRVPLFPALLAILMATAIGFASLRELPVSKRRAGGVIFATAMICGAFLLGCGSKTPTPSTATPLGQTTMNVTANALDSNGNSLNAGRGLQIMLDVIK